MTECPYGCDLPIERHKIVIDVIYPHLHVRGDGCTLFFSNAMGTAENQLIRGSAE